MTTTGEKARLEWCDMLTVGIVGLPNVGKSTLFNALTAGGAEVSNYPFTTIDPNLGVVAVPDPRLAALERLLEPPESTPTTIEFIDIAGLVEGASRGEGLGNQFLGAIRQVDAVAHVVRCFAGTEVAHVFAEVDPVRDAQIVETELLLADLEVLDGAVVKKQRLWKANPRDFEEERQRLLHYREKLAEGVPLRSLELDRPARQELKALGLLTGKPLLYVANVAEEDLAGEGLQAAGQLSASLSSGSTDRVLPVAVKLEAELRELEPAERAEFMAAMGLESSALDRLVETAFELLGLIRFYTLVSDKLRAWEVPEGTLAPQAAGRIHGDMEKGFIRARVASCDEVLEHGSFEELHHHGLLRTEGKEYPIRDGDVVEFLFSGG